MGDTVLIVVLAAAVAFAAVEFVSGPLMVRALVNRGAVLRWLVAGLHTWRGRPTPTWQRIQQFFTPMKNLKFAARRVADALASMSASTVGEALTPQQEAPWRYSANSLARALIAVATGGSWSAFYRLEGDQLAAQVNAAAEAVLDAPRPHAILLVALAGIRRMELTEPDKKNPLAAFLLQDSTVSTSGDDKATAAVRHELTLRIQRRLDHLQITTRSYQQIANQLLCLAAAAGAAYVLVPEGSVLYSSRVTLGIIAGILAPLTGRLLRGRAS